MDDSNRKAVHGALDDLFRRPPLRPLARPAPVFNPKLARNARVCGDPLIGLAAALLLREREGDA